MKTHRVYGDATITGKATVLTPLTASVIESEVPFENRKNISFEVKDNENVEELIIKKIKSEFDDEFDIADYGKEISEGPDGSIYDFSIMIGDAKTTHGYTALIENNTVEIYDNMEDFKEKAKLLIETQNNSCKLKSSYDNASIERYKKETLSNYKKKYKEYNVSIDSTKKFYDDDEDRIVLDINVRIEDPTTGAYSIYTETI